MKSEELSRLEGRFFCALKKNKGEAEWLYNVLCGLVAPCQLPVNCPSVARWWCLVAGQSLSAVGFVWSLACARR